MASSKIDLREARWRKSTHSNGSGGNCVEIGEHFPGAARWRKSSYSNGSGGSCVEIGEDFPGAAQWRKSTHSNGDGGDCVEIGENFPGAAQWRKSSYSNGSGGDCVEIATEGLTGVVPVRDTKTAPHGPALVFPAGQWARFVAAIHEGRFTT